MRPDRAQLIVDFGSRILTSLVVTKDGQLLPVSQEIRQVATRHVPTGIVFDSRVSEDPDFLWEDALEAIEKAGAHNFFQRARRIGLRRLWDADGGGVLLASPLAVLSSPGALADPRAHRSLATVGIALLEAILEPTFAFLAGHSMKSAEIDPILILPSNVGRLGRVVLQKIFRRRGFPRPAIVPREIAAAMALGDGLATDCLVCDLDDDLRLSRMHIERAGDVRRFRRVSAQTIRGIGWTHWMQRIAAATHERTSAVDRAITALLGGLPSSINYGALQTMLTAKWIDSQRDDIHDVLEYGDGSHRVPTRRNRTSRFALPESGDSGRRTPEVPMILAGPLFAIDAMRELFAPFGEPCESLASLEAPMLDRLAEGVAAAVQWLREDPARRLEVECAGTLRLDSFRGEALELLPEEQLPQSGERCVVQREFRFAGDAADDESFLLHVVFGCDDAPAGNATLCAVPLDLAPGDRDRSLRVAVQARRSDDGRRLIGRIEAHLAPEGASMREHFVQEIAMSAGAAPGTRRVP